MSEKKKWIWFRLDEVDSQKRKTDIWHVLTTEGNFYLGCVKWFGRWRCYSFFPYSSTVFEKQCMRDIADFIESETKAYAKKKIT